LSAPGKGGGMPSTHGDQVAEVNRGGRPRALTAERKTLDQLRGLGLIQCTTKEAAAALLVSEPTFIKFLKDFPEAREAFDTGKGQGCVSLRRKQFALAE